MITQRKAKNLVVRLSDLGQSGLTFSEELNLEELNTRMQASPGNDIVFLSTPQVEIKIIPLPEGAEVTGKISSDYTQSCGRCLEQLKRPISVKFRYQLKPHTPEISEDELDDAGLIFYSGEHVDLKEHLEEALILAMSPYLLPALDQTGKCSECKKKYELPQGNNKKAPTLGDALNKIKLENK
jgi:uncharacterized metal-binding protein YceD (DUF177 family)